MDLSISDDTDALLCDDQEKENGSESAEKESEEMEDDWDYAEEDDKAYGEEEEEDDDDDDVESEEEDDAENHDPFNARQSSHQRAPSKTQSSANKDKPSNTNLRRSGRERTSTVIHVKGGHTIKKDNNYTVKGTSYSYGTVTEADLQVKKKKVSKYVAKTNKPAANKSTPMRSSQETNRLQYKRDVEQSIQIKQPLRQAFLKQHLSVLSPFIEPKVKARIEQHEGRQTKELQVFMQPDAIQTELRDYQLQGLQWMARMHAHNMGMILGDEMVRQKKRMHRLYLVISRECLTLLADTHRPCISLSSVCDRDSAKRFKRSVW
jgi:SNF2 family DNA or RNA helicase